ncbi:cytochrome c oxidase subunit II [Vulgatibacter sp.]|uniref:cytochrome c oxidase subunit II n=1 Tax=Vulgatibacter sp. TaxID=1971226 RepID=UPI00356A792F
MNEFLRILLFLPEQGSTVADEVDRLHFVVIATTMIGATAVFAVALWFTFRYRRRDEAALTPRVTAPTVIEVGVVLGLLSLFLLFWVVGFQQYMRLRVAPADTIDVYVTARKWMWSFAYPDGKRSNAVLVVPAGKPMRLIMTSRDVIHSFYVPAFRLKQDVLPGRTTTLWFQTTAPGVYRVFCAEYCGTSHSRMWADVVALADEGWEEWLAGEEPPNLVAGLLRGEAGDRGKSSLVAVREAPRGVAETGEVQSLAEQGLEVAARRGCLSCHSLDGQPHLGPSFRGLYGRYEQLRDGSVFVDEAYLTRSMMEPMAEVVAGYQPIMPTYQGQLQPAEVGALLELIKSLRQPLAVPQRIDYPQLPPRQAPGPDAEAP